MRIISTVRGLSDLLLKSIKNRTLGFVPTMGALHSGHLSLIKKSCTENDFTICSIFVNPTQFNNSQDLKKYPSQLNSDLALLEESGCDFVFTPLIEEIYPENYQPKTYSFGLLENVMEAVNRPGHFNGVAMVVSRLFSIVKPQKAYFGEKDFQQLAIVKSMVIKEKIPVQIISCPIVREPSGLAMSSRNTRLTEYQRRASSRIYSRLRKVVKMQPNHNVAELKNWVLQEFKEDSDLELEYFEISDPNTLSPSFNWSSSETHIACIAIFVGEVRLIDNILLRID
tara:strand:+ start:1654 stop:2502 length:849 start_codon:yes stop_codon:yes gene_type:complete